MAVAGLKKKGGEGRVETGNSRAITGEKMEDQERTDIGEQSDGTEKKRVENVKKKKPDRKKEVTIMPANWKDGTEKRRTARSSSEKRKKSFINKAKPRPKRDPDKTLMGGILRKKEKGTSQKVGVLWLRKKGVCA